MYHCVVRSKTSSEERLECFVSLLTLIMATEKSEIGKYFESPHI